MTSRNRRKEEVERRLAVGRVRKEHGEAMRTRYYRTYVKRDCRCKACGRKLRSRRQGARPRDEMVYRKQGQVTLCVPCADHDSLVDYRVSLRWERARQLARNRSR